MKKRLKALLAHPSASWIGPAPSHPPKPSRPNSSPSKVTAGTPRATSASWPGPAPSHPPNHPGRTVHRPKSALALIDCRPPERNRDCRRRPGLNLKLQAYHWKTLCWDDIYKLISARVRGRDNPYQQWRLRGFEHDGWRNLPPGICWLFTASDLGSLQQPAIYLSKTAMAADTPALTPVSSVVSYNSPGSVHGQTISPAVHQSNRSLLRTVKID
jgi:hypothetical protein